MLPSQISYRQEARIQFVWATNGAYMWSQINLVSRLFLFHFLPSRDQKGTYPRHITILSSRMIMERKRNIN